LTAAVRQTLVEKEMELSKSGSRVLSFIAGKSPQDLYFVGFIAMYDPPRKNVNQIISELIPAGIRFVMITGDSCIPANQMELQKPLLT
jgi:P-type E1-E2 ATPase